MPVALGKESRDNWYVSAINDQCFHRSSVRASACHHLIRVGKCGFRPLQLCGGWSTGRGQFAERCCYFSSPCPQGRFLTMIIRTSTHTVIRIPTRCWRPAYSTIAGVTFAAFVFAAHSAAAQSVGSLRVMSYNILAGGFGSGRPLSWTVDVMEAAQADVIGIQEGGGLDPMIATALGFNIQRFVGGTTIFSRYPITQVIANLGVKLQLSATQEAYVFDVHLLAYPYQPYDFRDGIITTEAQAIAAAQATRGAATTTLLNNMSAALATGDPVFLTGDFNEPSHLDWTQEAADAGLHFGKKVAWPASTAVTNAGLTDSFRTLRPDELADRGETWTPGSLPPNVAANEVHDRIDFVYYAGANVSPVEALVLGYDTNDGNTDIGVQPYPSDHRSLVVEFDFPGCGTIGDVNSDCAINSADWMQFRNGQQTDMTGLTTAQAYAKGDLNGDFMNNHADFVLFKNSYMSAHGTASFARLLAVPEPAGALLTVWIAVSVLCSIRTLTRTVNRTASQSMPSSRCAAPKILDCPV